MEQVTQMRQFARYVDQTTAYLLDIVNSGRYDALRQGCDEDLLKNISESIDQQKDEVQKMFSQLKEVESLSNLMNDTRSALDELKRYGVFCEMPVALGHLGEERKQVIEFRKSPTRSPPDVAVPRRAPVQRAFRPIEKAEYDSLPTLVSLLVKLEDMNKHYSNLFESGKEKFTTEEVAEIVPLSTSRLSAFIRALTSLGRIDAQEDGSTTLYLLL